MRTAILAVTLASALVVAPVLAAPTPAAADGDPASDVLLAQDAFFPYTAVSQSTERQVDAVLAASRQVRYPVKVAMIASKSDLGVVPSLFGKPQQYATFLSSELVGVVQVPVLVVMPNGFGLANGGRQQSIAALTGLAVGAGTDGLAGAATSAVRRLAAAAGHPLPARLPSASTSTGASASTIRHALSAILVLSLAAVVAIAAAFRARTSRASRPPAVQ